MKRSLLLLAVLLFAPSCTNTRHLATQVDATVATAVFAVDDAELTLCNQKVLTDQQCADLNPKIKAALQDVKTATAAIQATPANGKVPASLADLIATLRSVQAIANGLPTNQQTAGLVQRVNVALDAAISVLTKITGAGV